MIVVALNLREKGWVNAFVDGVGWQDWVFVYPFWFCAVFAIQTAPYLLASDVLGGVLSSMAEALEGFRIVHVSDVQADPRTDDELLGRYVDLVNGLDADLVLFTGVGGDLAILLSHQPTLDVVDVADRVGNHLMTSGHTHGGQVTIQVFGTPFPGGGGGYGDPGWSAGFGG